jgi:hypothetical protein
VEVPGVPEECSLAIWDASLINRHLLCAHVLQLAERAASHQALPVPALVGQISIVLGSALSNMNSHAATHTHHTRAVKKKKGNCKFWTNSTADLSTWAPVDAAMLLSRQQRRGL